MKSNIIIIGGGIAGISCLESLFADFDRAICPFRRIILISNSRLVKRVANYQSRGRNLDQFDVIEDDIEDLRSNVPEGLEFEYILGHVSHIDVDRRTVAYRTAAGDLKINYDILCICSGSRPRSLSLPMANSESIKKRIITIRDLTSIDEFREKLKDCRQLVIVGNGGIGMELVAKVRQCKKFWIIRDQFIGSPFFDPGASKFIVENVINCDRYNVNINSTSITHRSCKGESELASHGPSLGPNWSHGQCFDGSSSDYLEISYGDELTDVSIVDRQEYPVVITTKKGKLIGCDLIVLALGVEPQVLKTSGQEIILDSVDGGIIIDSQMRTSVERIYAAGDVVSCQKWPKSDLWFQMRLWTQARQMGHYLGKCIDSHLSGRDPSIYFNFECFTHCTSFFGQKLVLLGRFNGQLESQEGCEQLEIIGRVDPGEGYTKLLINTDGHIVGATLLGEKTIDETIENLIHDRVDVSSFKDQLLEDIVDIEDFFD